MSGRHPREATRELAEADEQVSWGLEVRMAFPPEVCKMAPANVECLLHARPCAKVVCCPTTQELGLGQLRHRQDSDLQEVAEQLR